MLTLITNLLMPSSRKRVSGGALYNQIPKSNLISVKEVYQQNQVLQQNVEILKLQILQSAPGPMSASPIAGPSHAGLIPIAVGQSQPPIQYSSSAPAMNGTRRSSSD